MKLVITIINMTTVITISSSRGYRGLALEKEPGYNQAISWSLLQITEGIALVLPT